MKLQIDPEFRALIPPLSDDERAQLEMNLQRDGCRDPLVVWKGLLLDGHNRFEICTENKWTYRVVDQLCADRDDAKIWIIRNQFGRRNLAAYARAELALKLEPLIAAKAKARQLSTLKRGSAAPVPPTLAERGSVETRAEIARAAGVSHGTIDKARVIASRGTEPVKEQLRRGDISIDHAYQDIKGQDRRAERVERIRATTAKNEPLDTSRPVPILYADPPWQYEHVKTDNRAIENQYPTLTLEEICALPVSDAATADAVLFLWATSPKLAEAMEVLTAWGFTYRTCMVWVKDKIGMGYYARQQHELLLIATKGEPPVPKPEHRPSSVVQGVRGQHSKKPDVFYELIEAMYPEFEKRELFARRTRVNWLAWGNQATETLAG